mmetsp:Transcript_81946/g.228390  ORF Transcript_81946/g.228390 Transcript_81946/m.228390 type:complete len:417 (-) Transcript_81946:287-1537(-)
MRRRGFAKSLCLWHQRGSFQLGRRCLVPAFRRGSLRHRRRRLWRCRWCRRRLLRSRWWRGPLLLPHTRRLAWERFVRDRLVVVHSFSPPGGRRAGGVDSGVCLRGRQRCRVRQAVRLRRGRHDPVVRGLLWGRLAGRTVHVREPTAVRQTAAFGGPHIRFGVLLVVALYAALFIPTRGLCATSRHLLRLRQLRVLLPRLRRLRGPDRGFLHDRRGAGTTTSDGSCAGVSVLRSLRRRRRRAFPVGWRLFVPRHALGRWRRDGLRRVSAGVVARRRGPPLRHRGWWRRRRSLCTPRHSTGGWRCAARHRWYRRLRRHRRSRSCRTIIASNARTAASGASHSIFLGSNWRLDRCLCRRSRDRTRGNEVIGRLGATGDGRGRGRRRLLQSSRGPFHSLAVRDSTFPILRQGSAFGGECG